MSADWRGVQAGLESGYQMGRASGGRLSVLGQSIAKLADNLRAQEVAGQQAQAGVLGEIRSARIKQMFDPEAQVKANIAAKIEAKQPLSPEENKLFYGYEAPKPIDGGWKPQTGNEALMFERAKAKLKPEKQPFTQGKIEQVKGALSSGKIFQGGMVISLPTEKRKEEYAQSQLGPNWKEYVGQSEKKATAKLEKKQDNIMDTNW